MGQPMTDASFRRDAQWFRTADGLGLLAGSPLTLFKVSDAGARVLDAIENDETLPANHGQLTARLLAAGAIHPSTTPTAPRGDLTVVIPAYITDPQSLAHLESLVESLAGFDIIVVDDASPIAVRIPGASIVRHETNRGPGAGRNTGLAQVQTSLVAFVDSDTMVSADDLASLGAMFDHPSVSLVAPRVHTIDEGTLTSEYDSWRSPLDMGDQPAVIKPTSRVPFVPSAVIVARVDALTGIGAFDEGVRIGEDVDLVWRLVRSGATCLYVPSVECGHRARPTVRALLRQRFNYGTSAATLDRNHPRAVTPLRAHVLLLAVAALVLSGNLLTATLAAPPVITFFSIVLRVTGLPVLTRIRLTWMGFTSTTRLLAAAVTRAWWPLFFVGSLFLPPATAMLTFSALVPATVGLVRRKPRRPLTIFFLRMIDDFAYGLGVWAGALRLRTARCLLPVITLRRTSPVSRA